MAENWHFSISMKQHERKSRVGGQVSQCNRIPVSEPPTPLVCQEACLLKHRGMTAKPTQDWAVLWKPVSLVEKSPSCCFHLWFLQIRKQASPSMERWHGNLQSWWKPIHWEVYRCLLNQLLQNRDKQRFSGDIKYFPLKKLLYSMSPALMNAPFWYDCTHDEVWWERSHCIKSGSKRQHVGLGNSTRFTSSGGPGVSLQGPGSPQPSSMCPQILWDESPGMGWTTSSWGCVLQQGISFGMVNSRAGPYPWLRTEACIR